MLDKWEVRNKETGKIEIKGTLKEILEELDVQSPEDIPSQFELTKAENK